MLSRLSCPATSMTQWVAPSWHKAARKIAQSHSDLPHSCSNNYSVYIGLCMNSSCSPITSWLVLYGLFTIIPVLRWSGRLFISGIRPRFVSSALVGSIRIVFCCLGCSLWCFGPSFRLGTFSCFIRILPSLSIGLELGSILVYGPLCRQSDGCRTFREGR